MEKQIPIVDQQSFDKIKCSRCGECCRILQFGSDIDEHDEEGRVGWWRHQGPLGYLELYAYYEEREVDFFSSFSDLWYGQLIPSLVDGRWRYECQYLVGDECSIYETRPSICSGFPYGKPVNTYPGCVWDVTLIDYEVVQWAGDTLPI